MRTIALFSDCAGFERASLTYHLAHILVDMGKTVLLVDADPQCTLTNLCLPQERLEVFWSEKEQDRDSLLHSTNKTVQGRFAFEDAHVENLRDQLALIASYPGLSMLEEPLAHEWSQALEGDVDAFRTMSALRDAIGLAAYRMRTDIILIDMGSSFSALNRAIACNVDNFLIPVIPEIRSVYGLHYLGATITRWKEERDLRAKQQSNPAVLLSRATMAPLGYIVTNPSVPITKYAMASEDWLYLIPRIYQSSILHENSIVATLADNSHCLSILRNHQILWPLARDVQKPIFHLRPADGAVGARMAAVQRCREDFEQLASKILERIQPTK